jgi:predicted DNA-binding transcriptional regulator AlpA
MLRLGISRRTLHRKIAEEVVPRPLRWGRRICWKDRDFTDFVRGLA